MANELTLKGQEYMLFGDGSGDGSIARLATALLLYHSSSVPDKNGAYGQIGAPSVDFFEVANGNGYTTGGISIVVGDWTYSTPSASESRITLGSEVWTASGGSISNIAGAMIIDGSGNVLAWWERSTVLTLGDGESLTVSGLYVSLP